MSHKYTFYDRQKIGKTVFFIFSVTAIIIFLLISNNLVKSLASQERERMQIWANATQRLAQQGEGTDIEFLFAIIQQNNTIPVLIADRDGNVLDYRNFDLPDAGKTYTMYMELSDKDKEYLANRLMTATGGKSPAEMVKGNKGHESHFIRIETFADTYQYIYYEDSEMLKRLNWYPYIQLGVMLFLAVIVFFSIVYTKRAEQNRVWVSPRRPRISWARLYRRSWPGWNSCALPVWTRRRCGK